MQTFSQKILDYLAFFTPYLTQQAVVFDQCFTKKEQTVAQFVAEIQTTAEKLASAPNNEYAELYAEKLLRQYDALKSAVKRLRPRENHAVFHSNYQFPRNIHFLPPPKRLVEYRKALRALNEKISWLIEQNLKTQNEAQKHQFQQQIQETEYRKMKCLKAIEELEEALSFAK